MTLAKRIQTCTELTPAEQQLASYILSHKETVLQLSISELAKETFLSPSSIHRFTHKLGLTGFKELKIELAQLLLEPPASDINVNFPFTKEDSLQHMSKQLLELYEITLSDTLSYVNHSHCQKVAMLLSKADTIDIYTHAHNAYPAGVFSDRMLAIGKKVRCPHSFYEQRAVALSSNPSHAAIVISYSGKASFIPAVLKILRKKRIPVVLISKPDARKDFPQIRYHLSISNQEHLQNRISQFSSHISLQYLLDLLYCFIFKLNYDDNLRILNESIYLLDDRQLDSDNK